MRIQLTPSCEIENFATFLKFPSSRLGFIWIILNYAFLANGQTIRKKILGIKVVRKSGAALERKRYVLFRYLPVSLISMVPVVGGFFPLVDSLMIFRDGKNTLHDDIADTKVVKVTT